MAAQVEKKQIFPGFVLYRPRFDLAEIDAAARKGLQHPMQHSGFILHGKHQRSFVIAARSRPHFADHHEPRNVIALVFNVTCYELQIVNFLCHRAGNRR